MSLAALMLLLLPITFKHGLDFHIQHRPMCWETSEAFAGDTMRKSKSYQEALSDVTTACSASLVVAQTAGH
jgi:hypothetical protein